MRTHGSDELAKPVARLPNCFFATELVGLSYEAKLVTEPLGTQNHGTAEYCPRLSSTTGNLQAVRKNAIIAPRSSSQRNSNE